MNHTGAVGHVRRRPDLFPAVWEAAHQSWGRKEEPLLDPTTSGAGLGLSLTLGGGRASGYRGQGWTLSAVMVSWGRSLMIILVLSPYHFLGHFCPEGFPSSGPLMHPIPAASQLQAHPSQGLVLE